MPTTRRAINFLHWLETQHPEIETLIDLCEKELIRLIDEFECIGTEKARGSRITRSYLSRILSEEARIRGLSKIYSIENSLAVLDFEKWVKDQQFYGLTLNEERVSTIIARYLCLKGHNSLYAYIRNMNALHYARMFNDFIEILVKMGAKIELPDTDSDFLHYYKSTPLRSVFLYTSEDIEVQEYLDANFEALDKLTGDSCLVFLMIDQHENTEGGYAFIEKLHVLRKSNLDVSSQLPGLFFWDKDEATEFVTFGPKPGIADIRFILRTLFVLV